MKVKFLETVSWKTLILNRWTGCLVLVVNSWAFWKMPLSWWTVHMLNVAIRYFLSLSQFPQLFCNEIFPKPCIFRKQQWSLFVVVKSQVKAEINENTQVKYFTCSTLGRHSTRLESCWPDACPIMELFLASVCPHLLCLPASCYNVAVQLLFHWKHWNHTMTPAALKALTMKVIVF